MLFSAEEFIKNFVAFGTEIKVIDHYSHRLITEETIDEHWDCLFGGAYWVFELCYPVGGKLVIEVRDIREINEVL